MSGIVNEDGLLAAILHSRRAYEAVRDHVGEEDLSAHGGAILAEASTYYDKDPDAKRCSLDILRDRLGRRLPKHAELFAEMLRNMTPDLGTVNVVQEVLDVQRKAAGDKLAVAIASGKPAGDVSELLDRYTVLNTATDLLDASGITLLETGWAEAARKDEDPSELLRVYPERFNKFIREGVLPGHCIVIIGRVNVGKSALAIGNIASFLQQGKRVLLCENEDLAEDVLRRIGCALVGCTLQQQAKWPERYEAAVRDKGGDNLMILDPPPTTVKELDMAAELYKPDVIVVNQVRHLAPGKEAASDNTGAVDRVAQQVRALGKRRRITTVLVGAAIEGERTRDPSGDDTPREKAVLHKDDSYGSRTGIPGVADVMLAVGDNTTLKGRSEVAIHLCKNKRKSQAEPVGYFKVDLEKCTFV